MQKSSKKIEVRLKFVGAFSKTEENLCVEKGITYLQLLEMLKINPETVILIKDGIPIPTDESVEGGEVKVLHVISGG
jgi:sulfur carrier protein